MHVKKLLSAALLLAALPASASIALFSDGRTMKIDSFRLKSETDIELKFKSGGAITIPLARIERIVDDEVAPPAVIAEVKKIVEEEGGIFPKRSWRYDAKRGPIFRSKYDSVIVEAAKKFDVDAALVSAVIKAESDFNPREYSNKPPTTLARGTSGSTTACRRSGRRWRTCSGSRSTSSEQRASSSGQGSPRRAR